MTTRLFPSSCRRVLAASCLALGVLACGGDDSGDTNTADGGASAAVDASTHADASPATTGDASAASDAAAVSDTGTPVATIPTLNGCASSDYLDKSSSAADRTIAIASMGLSFTPKCITIAKGQTVKWTGSLSTHPLEAGNSTHPDAGTAGSPILPTSTGNAVEFSFPNAGTYPYYCTVHSFGDGEGMAGSIHVQ